MSHVVRWGAPVLMAVLGVGSGVAAVALHQRWWGLAVGLLAGVAVTVAVPAGWARRVPWAAGWLVAVGLATTRRAEGDYLVPANVAGYALIIATLALAVVAMVTLPGRHGLGGAAEDPGQSVSRT